jgi:hypothetical protein
MLSSSPGRLASLVILLLSAAEPSASPISLASSSTSFATGD